MTAAILPALYEHNEPRETAGRRALKLAVVLGLHIGILAWVLGASTTTLPPTSPPKPMDVRIIAMLPTAKLPEPITPKAAAMPPKPLPTPSQAKRPVERPVPAPTPSPALSAAPDSTPGPTSFAVAPQAAAPAKQDAPVAQQAAPAAPAAVASPARFDADYLQNPAPAYPNVSKRKREEGTVMLLVRVSAKGEAEHVQIQQGSGFSRLDEVAVKTVQQWRFVPARLGQEAVAASVVVPIVFRLDS